MSSENGFNPRLYITVCVRTDRFIFRQSSTINYTIYTFFYTLHIFIRIYLFIYANHTHTVYIHFSVNLTIQSNTIQQYNYIPIKIVAKPRLLCPKTIYIYNTVYIYHEALRCSLYGMYFFTTTILGKVLEVWRFLH